MHNDKAGCLGLENTQKELATEKQARIEADAQLMQTIASLEITVANETTNRQEADTALQIAIDDESSARQEAIDSLNTAIEAEAAIRQETDNNLQSAIDSKAALVHAHDDRYYTESEINSKLANYANVYIGSSQPSSSESAKLWVVI